MLSPKADAHAVALQAVRGLGGVNNAAPHMAPCLSLPPLSRGETSEALWVEAGSKDVTGGCKPEWSERSWSLTET